MAEATSVPLRKLALGDFEHELALTRKVLERVPDDQLDFRPHPRSWTLRELATHVARIPSWDRYMLAQPELDLATLPPGGPLPSNREELLALFDGNVADAKEALASVTDESLLESWTLRAGAHVIMQQPRAAMVRALGMSHLVHHRGQLTVYLRMVEAPVPGMYGPSADEG